MKLQFVILEDDYFDWEWTRDALKEEFPDVDLQWVSTEQAFVDRLPEFAKRPPNLFVLDIMLPWSEPQRGQAIEEVPEDVRRQGIYAAGFRCLNRMRETPSLKVVPYVLYTGLDVNNFSEYVVHTKSDNIGPLIEEIRKQLGIGVSTR